MVPAGTTTAPGATTMATEATTTRPADFLAKTLQPVTEAAGAVQAAETSPGRGASDPEV